MNRFDSVVPTVDQASHLAALRLEFAETARSIEAATPEGRYRALALTALEEAAMWASKAVTH